MILNREAILFFCTVILAGELTVNNSYADSIKELSSITNIKSIEDNINKTHIAIENGTIIEALGNFSLIQKQLSEDVIENETLTEINVTSNIQPQIELLGTELVKIEEAIKDGNIVDADHHLYEFKELLSNDSENFRLNESTGSNIIIDYYENVSNFTLME